MNECKRINSKTAFNDQMMNERGAVTTDQLCAFNGRYKR